MNAHIHMLRIQTLRQLLKSRIFTKMQYYMHKIIEYDTCNNVKLILQYMRQINKLPTNKHK
jgi:hypothetical protein